MSVQTSKKLLKIFGIIDIIMGVLVLLCSLLALTGVNNIGTLRPFWQQHECWFRILSRSLSQQMAQQAQFPEDHLVYYEEDDTDALLSRLSPQAILTKESGLSGGFQEKVEAARSRGISVFVPWSMG